MKQILGYFLGFVLFIAGIPALMWWASGLPSPSDLPVGRLYLAALTALAGLSISVWTIIYMKRVGKGNPMDAFGHEVAPRTQHLMTEGPYRLNRNPMLTGTLVYLAGWAIWLWSWQAALVLAAFFGIMFLQVLSEEKRLRRDFGDAYDDYCRRTRRF